MYITTLKLFQQHYIELETLFTGMGHNYCHLSTIHIYQCPMQGMWLQHNNVCYICHFLSQPGGTRMISVIEAIGAAREKTVSHLLQKVHTPNMLHIRK